MIKRKNSSMITLVMVTVVMIDLSRVKTPFLLPATLRGSCLVMKSAKFQIISPKSDPFQIMLLINHAVCRRWTFWATPSQCQGPKGKSSDARTYEPSLGTSCVKRFEVFPHQLSLVFLCEDLPLVSSNIDKKCVLPDLSNTAGFPHHAGLHVKASHCVSAVLSNLQIQTFYM